jgi:hypothetical protein
VGVGSPKALLKIRGKKRGNFYLTVFQIGMPTRVDGHSSFQWAFYFIKKSPNSGGKIQWVICLPIAPK